MNRYQEIIDDVQDYINSNIEEALSSNDVAKAVNYSYRQLNRIFSIATGITIGEYIRWKKLVKSLFDLKNSDDSIINIAVKYGYESQESYTRAFKDSFSLNPGEYRKTKQQIITKNWHLNQFLHQEAHNALNNGFNKQGNVNNWIVIKPNRIWVHGRKNINKLHPSKFYALPIDDLLKQTFSLPNIIGSGGAYFPSNDYSGLSFGVEVDEDYSLEMLKGLEITRILGSKYVVFNHPKYSIENHGDVIYSTWKAQKDYNIKEQGLEWNFDKMPIFEDDDEEIGYTLWFPVFDIKKSDY